MGRGDERDVSTTENGDCHSRTYVNDFLRAHGRGYCNVTRTGQGHIKEALNLLNLNANSNSCEKSYYDYLALPQQNVKPLSFGDIFMKQVRYNRSPTGR